MLKIVPPETIGLDPSRWSRCLDRAEQWCSDGELPSASLLVLRDGQTTGTHGFGRQQLDGTAPLRDDAIFLIASITKPLVAMAAMKLVEDGQMAVGDRVRDYIPEFKGGVKRRVTIRNLLTHTSGLPDMLSNNRELRVAEEPLTTFVRETCGVDLEFSPGENVRYQSMGFALLGEIVARLTDTSCAEFLRREFFDPIGMHDTALGAPDDWFDETPSMTDRIAEIRLPESQSASDHWNWNNRYWRSLGAPWGGLLTTPWDLGLYAQMMLNEGRVGGRQILSPATIRSSTSNQLLPMKLVPETDRRCRPWGFGWRLNWPAHSANFGDLLGPRTYGHWGATGTALWIDPERNAAMVFLTTQPQEPHGRYLACMSNMVAAAFRDDA